MALLGKFIDQRTIASIATNGSASFAHGLPSAPDFVIVFGQTTATLASGGLPSWSADATNVSLFATGAQATPANLQIDAVVAHSIIR